MKFTVTEKAMRPVSDAKECYYCHKRLGSFHEDHCVLINKKVKIRMTIEYEVSVPNHWKKNDVEFHRNESSWCAGNAIEELSKLSGENGCLCNKDINFEYVSDESEAYLEE